MRLKPLFTVCIVALCLASQAQDVAPNGSLGPPPKANPPTAQQQAANGLYPPVPGGVPPGEPKKGYKFEPNPTAEQNIAVASQLLGPDAPLSDPGKPVEFIEPGIDPFVWIAVLVAAVFAIVLARYARKKPS